MFLIESCDLYDGDDEFEYGNSVFVLIRSFFDLLKYLWLIWRLDESELLILLDSRFGFFDLGISVFNIFDRERKNFGLDFYEGFNKFFGISLVDVCKVKKYSSLFLVNLFLVNLVELVDCVDGLVFFKLS